MSLHKKAEMSFMTCSSIDEHCIRCWEKHCQKEKSFVNKCLTFPSKIVIIYAKCTWFPEFFSNELYEAPGKIEKLLVHIKCLWLQSVRLKNVVTKWSIIQLKYKIFTKIPFHSCYTETAWKSHFGVLTGTKVSCIFNCSAYIITERTVMQCNSGLKREH